MGIFSDTCEKCGNKVSKRARFCNKCGTPAPGGWWKCPQCGKWIGNDSAHCPHCNAVLHPDERVLVAGGVWAREPGAFAQRIEIGDAKRLLRDGLQIQEGTVAVVLDSGEIKDVVGAGRYEPESLARKLNWFGNPPPRSVVLIDAGEVAIPLRVENLRTSEGIEVEFYGEAIFRFAGTKEAAKAFVANVLKGSRKTGLEELSARAAPLIAQAVEELCTTSTLDDLVKDPERRARLRERMEARLTEDFAAAGLEVVRVSGAEFGGEAYEELEDARGDWEVARRTAEQAAALRELKSRAEMGRFKDEKELAAYKETLDAEYRTAEAERQREWDQLKAGWAHDDALSELARKAELEAARREAEEAERLRRYEGERAETEHKIGLDTLAGEHERAEKVADAKAEAAVSGIAADEEMRQAAEALKLREQKEALRLKVKAQDAARRKGMAAAELLADLEDAAAREAQLEALRLQTQAAKTADQLLAEQGIDPKANTQVVSKLEELHREAQERAERLASRALDAANEAARRPEGGSTIVK